jgi:hypothetical protein
LLEELVRDAFVGRRYFEESALPSIRELSRIYGLELPRCGGGDAEECAS